MNIRWDYFINQYDTSRYVSSSDGRDNRHIQFVREFASVVSVLQDKTNSVIDLFKDISRAIEDLATCSYTTEAFSELLNRIQAAVRHVTFFEMEQTLKPPVCLDRPSQPGRLCESRPLGGKARRANRSHPHSASDANHTCVVL